MNKSALISVVVAFLVMMIGTCLLGNMIIDRAEKALMEEESNETLKTDENLVELNVFRVPNNEIAEPVENRYLNDVSFADGALIWTSAGSSSCPPLIEKAVLNKADNTVTLTKVSYRQKMCTMDMAPVQQMIVMPDDSDLDDTIEIIFAEETL